MELKDFVSETIVQITTGILEAQSKLAETRVRINPKPPKEAAAASPMMYLAGNGAGVFPLSFEVAVTAEDREAVEGRAGFGIKVLKVFNAEAKAQGNVTETRSSVSRISFTVPIAYPLKDTGEEGTSAEPEQESQK